MSRFDVSLPWWAWALMGISLAGFVAMVVVSVVRNRGMKRRVDPQVGEEVLLVGEQGAARVTIDEMAEKLGTIQHEISIGFAQRMPRIFT